MTSFSATRLPSSQAAAKAIRADVTIVMAGSSPFEPPQSTVSAVRRSTSSRLDMPDAARPPEFTPAKSERIIKPRRSRSTQGRRADVYFRLSLGSPCPSCPSCLICPIAGYNAIGQQTGENWYATATLQNPTQTISLTYNSAGWLQSETDQVGSNAATDSYTYDLAGEVQTDTQSVPGLTPTVTLNESYANGDRTQVAAAIGSTNDFVNNYTYQGPLGQMSEVTQSSNGGNTVAPKAATFAYDYLGEFTGVKRYNTAGTSQLVAQAAYSYDNDGNLTSLVYKDGESTPVTLDSLAWTYDQLANVKTSSSSLDSAGAVTFTNDSTGQLKAATGGPAPNESYVYDANGNRTNTGYSTGANNELLCDGTYHYQYDAEGNRIARWVQSPGNAGKPAPASGDTNITLYAWDNRDRLTSVTQYATYGGSATQTVTYIYDASNRWIGETITPATGAATQRATSTTATRSSWNSTARAAAPWRPGVLAIAISGARRSINSWPTSR